MLVTGTPGVFVLCPQAFNCLSKKIKPELSLIVFLVAHRFVHSAHGSGAVFILQPFQEPSGLLVSFVPLLSSIFG